MKILSPKTNTPSKSNFELEGMVLELRTRYNYLAECWTLDIADAQGDPLLTGLMLVPGHDLLTPYLELKKTLGALVLVEKSRGDYKSPDLLGINTKLLWFSPGERVAVPI